MPGALFISRFETGLYSETGLRQAYIVKQVCYWQCIIKFNSAASYTVLTYVLCKFIMLTL